MHLFWYLLSNRVIIIVEFVALDVSENNKFNDGVLMTIIIIMS